jgi:hypothetical protein
VPLALSHAQEAPVLAPGVGEVDEKPVTRDTEEHGEDAFDNEDPAPAVEAREASHLHDLEKLV